MGRLDRAQGRSRYEWVDFAKGFCIVAVVTMWIVGEMQGYVSRGQAGWMGYFAVFAKPFRMPDFFLISGLFLSRVIDRPWRHYLDTKVVHYLYFFVLWTLIVVPATWLLGHDTPASLGEGLGSLAWHLYDPFQMLWFVMMLSVYFVATRLLRRVPAWIVLPAALLLMLFPLKTGIYHVDRFGVYFGFFYAGHIFAERFFALADWARAHRRAATVGVIVWALFNGTLIKLQLTDNTLATTVLGFLGISAVVVVSALVCEQRWAAPLKFLGRTSITVYLGFYLPMIVLVPMLRASSIGDQHSLVGTLALVGCIGSAVLMAEIARRLGLGFLYERPTWARLVDTPPAGDAGRRTTGNGRLDPV
ncbi:acyltransferase family protein [Sphaerotilus uruguayifluvii]|uniref:Membrane protein YcfT n=1 Tax=Sphaerotilus uruguayifluvii TaxID=2735897 RepID=A0ABX2FYY3_9BURK|nr:acyltransferase family protein [Leptothrix sp. C29]NRT55219.1 putative membrane protein YcfT [Leptothrix sp. C29]